MTISIYSRYANDTVTPISDKAGVTRSTILINPPSVPATFSISTYTWQTGDQIDYLAYSAYRDETQWWRLADANPEILFWNNIVSGTQIRVPNA
jgi:hypothetical protein